ncbi:BgTH12-00362 [Blumeria graminis f. sp. triticale]|uniref:Bgt-55082 n=2 Tax=Blumeria graminis TaxID=34373 RepID=A0A9X9MLZ0_BLUGR|nr:BgTH12-00362 [Blumeria graminis f. sp. triticale]VDB92881.1 Bgt-55082 [Blumeria graminis f. sp. tritici]
MHLRYLLAVAAFLLDSATSERYGYMCRPDTQQFIMFDQESAQQTLTEYCPKIQRATNRELNDNTRKNRSPAYFDQVVKLGYSEYSIVVRVPGPHGLGTGFIITDRNCAFRTMLYMFTRGLRRCYYGALDNFLYQMVKEPEYAPVEIDNPHTNPVASSLWCGSHSSSS